MSSYGSSGQVYSDYTPVDGHVRDRTMVVGGPGMNGSEAMPVPPRCRKAAVEVCARSPQWKQTMSGVAGLQVGGVAGLQAEGPAWLDDITEQMRSAYGNEVKVLSVKPGGAGAPAPQRSQKAPNPPPRLVNAPGEQGYTQHGGEVQTTRPPAVQSQGSGRFEQVEFLRGGDTDLSPQQLMDAATGWAKRNGFSTEQLQEFGHLITMVAATYIPRSQISGFRALDQGSFGMIYSASYDGAAVAVKQCSSDGSQIKAKMRELLLELSVLVRIRHPNVVTFWGTAADFPTSSASKPYIGMVFELCSRGSLYKALHQVPQGGARLSFKDKMRMALEVARGMGYIHAKGIIHRDLNSRNILITSTGQAKVADFGCARKLKGAALVTTTISGSPAYMAPEQLEGHDLTDKVDVWAFGISLWEMAMEKVPWASKGNSLDALKRTVVVNGERLPLPGPERFPAGWQAHYVKLLDMAWHQTPSSRPSMVDLARGLEALLKSQTVSVGEFM